MFPAFLSVTLVDIILTKTSGKIIENGKAGEHCLKNYEELSDLELTTMSSEGDESAFAEIVRRYSPRVFRFAGRFFRQRSFVE